MKYIVKKSVVELPQTTGSISDTTNIEDKVTNTYSARVIESLVGSGGGADVSTLADLFYPIGRGFLDFTDTDYSNWLGLTWERELVGMTPIGYNPDDTDYATVGTTGGKKTLTLKKENLPNYTLYNASHGHTVNDPGHAHTWYSGSNTGSADNTTRYRGDSKSNSFRTDASGTGIWLSGTTIKVTSGGSNTPIDLRTPYKVVSYWKRVA